MPSRNVSLTAEQDAYIESRVRSGHYGNASEVVRDAIRELQKAEAEDQVKLEALKLAIAEGLEGQPLDGPAAMAELKERIRARAAARAGKQVA